MLRIRLEPAELARVRFTAEPHPVGTAMLASQALRDPGVAASAPALARHVERASASLRPLFHLLPARGALPDFLTPLDGIESVDAGLSAIRATPHRRIRAEVGTTYTHVRATAMRRRFAAADPEVLDALIGSLRRFFHDVLAPFWPHVLRLHALEVGQRSRPYALSGVGGVLDGLHPMVRWRAPVLEVDTLEPTTRNARLDGHGVILAPSPFAGPHPRALVQPGRSALVAYQAGSLAVLASDRSVTRGGDPLADLMGRTRAAVLRRVVAPGRHTTSTLARHAGVSPSSASEHLTALRAAGLVDSTRDGGAVVHRVTALGADLANAAP